QAEGRGVIFAAQEMLGQAIESALSSRCALTQRAEQGQRLDPGLDSKREDLGHCGMDGEAGNVVRELRDRGRPDGSYIERLVAHRLEHGFVFVVTAPVAADPDGELAALRAARAAADRRIEEMDALLRELPM